MTYSSCGYPHGAVLTSSYLRALLEEPLPFTWEAEPYKTPPGTPQLEPPSWDGAVVCLAGLLEEARPVRLQASVYSAFLATNNARGFTREPDQTLANLLSASCLALTTDGWLLLNRQSSENLSGHGLLAPSGAGGVDYEDLEGCGSLQEVLATAAHRELREESGVPLELVASWRLLDLVYNQSFACKPEAYLLTRLAGTRQEVAASLLPLSPEEQARTQGVEWHRPESLSPQSPDLTAPLAHALTCLWEERGAIYTALA